MQYKELLTQLIAEREAIDANIRSIRLTEVRRLVALMNRVSDKNRDALAEANSILNAIDNMVLKVFYLKDELDALLDKIEDHLEKHLGPMRYEYYAQWNDHHG